MSPQAAPPNNTADTDVKSNGQNAATALVGSYVLDGAHVVTIDEALRAEGVESLTYIRGADAYGQAGGPADPKDLAAAVALAKESTFPTSQLCTYIFATEEINHVLRFLGFNQSWR